MLRNFLAILALLSTVICPVLAESSVSIRQRLDQDRQVALDLEHLDVDKLLKTSTGTLVIAKLNPASDAGQTIFINHYKDVTDPKTGVVSKVLQYATSDGGAEVTGHYTSYDAFTGQKIADGYYKWTTPYIMDRGYYIQTEAQLLPWTEHDNRFILGGTLICAINAHLSGSGMFNSDALIPTDWKQYVAGALDYHKKYPGNFLLDNTQKNNPDLVRLANSPNHFLSIEATRSLAKSGLLGTPFIQSSLAKADFYKQAVYTLLVLNNSTLQTKPERIKDLNNLISSSTNAEAIKGIALAAFMINDDVLLKQLKIKMADLNSNTSADAYIANILSESSSPKIIHLAPQRIF